MITAANFCMNGKLAVVGTYDGRCIFYETEVRIKLCHTISLYRCMELITNGLYTPKEKKSCNLVPIKIYKPRLKIVT